MPAWRAVGSVLVAAAMVAPATARLSARRGQLLPGPVKELATGKILIAQRDLPDPHFSRTVVLIVELNGEGTVGLILNRRSEIALASVFQKMKPREGSPPVFYLGGPVQTDGVIGLLRADKGPKDTQHIFADVYVTSGREPLEDMVAAGADPSRFRAYLGYSGWSPGQLERETAQGSWRVLKSVAGTVFDPNPDSLWERLIDQTEGLSASRLPDTQLPLPQAVDDGRGKAMSRLSGDHDDLPAVMGLVRDEVGEDVADVERQVAPHVALRWRHLAT